MPERDLLIEYLNTWPEKTFVEYNCPNHTSAPCLLVKTRLYGLQRTGIRISLPLKGAFRWNIPLDSCSLDVGSISTLPSVQLGGAENRHLGIISPQHHKITSLELTF